MVQSRSSLVERPSLEKLQGLFDIPNQDSQVLLDVRRLLLPVNCFPIFLKICFGLQIIKECYKYSGQYLQANLQHSTFYALERCRVSTHSLLKHDAQGNVIYFRFV